ncbi:MAG: alpha/beta hydrolase [Pirellulales bacterium]
MNACLRLVVVGWLLLAAPIASAQERGRRARGESLVDAQVQSEVRLYRKAPEGELFLHLYFPQGWNAADTRPAIVLFFGGGWRTGSYEQFAAQAEYFASRGLVAAAADYRIFTQHHTTPDKAVEDAKAAMRWMRAHAGELGVDANKIIAAGGSAGGHLAAATATLEDFDAPGDDAKVSCQPCALVLFNPVLNFTGMKERMFFNDDVENDEMKKKLSPTLHLTKNTPPAILFYGAEDKFLSQGEEYVARAKELGVRAELYVAPKMSHGFFNRTPWTAVTTRAADDFLESLGYLQGEPTLKMPANAPKLEKR